MKMITRDQVLQANIDLHTRLAEVYKETEPHYRPENQKRVEGILMELAKMAGNGSLLDIGCGMGFIIDIAKRHFRRITGIDITEAMLEKVNQKAETCEISVKVAEVERMPFPDASFDVATAYAVIHHLHALKPAFAEAFRVLKQGGYLYTDTDPNYYFWEAIRNLPEGKKYSPIVQREFDAVRYKDRELEEKFGIPPDMLCTAEILKHDSGGFKAEELEKLLYDIGFSEVKVFYEWYIGEAYVIHSADICDCAEQISRILNEQLPLTRHLFKYLRIIAQK
ncbi:MAG: methyltransferase domain-containing protein [Desulfobacteraceae bacterium]|nr:methyltransferase domain-containing protein [Desulfobacteraceae bacterium]MBC2756729.1 methyltransferase domain-containing protein [Desulfobacteraceae bacterium]